MIYHIDIHEILGFFCSPLKFDVFVAQSEYTICILHILEKQVITFFAFFNWDVTVGFFDKSRANVFNICLNIRSILLHSDVKTVWPLPPSTVLKHVNSMLNEFKTV